jgi:hypothetical protein
MKATNMHSASCAGRTGKIPGLLHEGGTGIAAANSSVMEFTLVANSEEDLLTYEQAHTGN